MPRLIPHFGRAGNDFSRASIIFDFICYADDTTLFCTLSKLVNAQNANPDFTIRPNIELAKINEWLEINKLLINLKNRSFWFFMLTQKMLSYP